MIYFKDESGAITFKENTYIPFEVLYIPEGVTYIDNHKYQYYTIKEVVIPEGVTEIQRGAFTGCSSLNGTLSLPSTLKKLGTSGDGSDKDTKDEGIDYYNDIFLNLKDQIF